MGLEPLGVVVLGEIEGLEAGDDGGIDDLDDIGLAHVLEHAVDRGLVLDVGDLRRHCAP